MRAETRPVGRWAVERVHVSGWGMVPDEGAAKDWAAENQAWNWAMGEWGSRCERCKPPADSCWVNWPAWVFWAAPEGATGGPGWVVHVSEDGDERERERGRALYALCGWCAREGDNIQMSFSDFAW